MQIKYTIGMLLLVATFSILNAQGKDQVLLIVGNDSVSSSEFTKIYNKNLDLVKDENQKDLDNYLNLFIEYQLKLSEARRLKLDEDKSYLKEYNSYKRQLTNSYVSENTVTDELVEEAYERMKWDVKASHILILLDENSKDTIQAYNRLTDLRPRLEREDIADLKTELHDGKTVIVEDLGYFSVFKMVYNFENVAFNTNVGEVSKPFRTRFGYHILKIEDKRPSKGTITAAHIMIANQQKDSTVIPEQRIRTIYKKLQSGEDFEDLAKQFSDDKGSAKNGGELRPFKSGDLSSPDFESQVFSLAENGDYSEPFQTKFGWHIAKRIKIEPIADFRSLRSTIENRVKRDSRSQLINEALVEQIRGDYKIHENNSGLAYFVSILNNEFYERQWKLPQDLKSNETLFSIEDQDYTYEEFAKFLQGQQAEYYKKKVSFPIIYQKTYDKFFSSSLIRYRREHLEEENEEFSSILKEYRDGLLLFELMESQIWNKASADSTGLRQFYNEHRDAYGWSARVDLVMASASDRSDLEQLKTENFSFNNFEALREDYQSSGSNIMFTSGVFEVGASNLPKDLATEPGDTKIYFHNNSFHLISIKEFLEPRLKTFDEAKGAVTNDYQVEIENQWMDDLKKRFPIWVNEKEFEVIKAKYE